MLLLLLLEVRLVLYFLSLLLILILDPVDHFVFCCCKWKFILFTVLLYKSASIVEDILLLLDLVFFSLHDWQLCVTPAAASGWLSRRFYVSAPSAWSLLNRWFCSTTARLSLWLWVPAASVLNWCCWRLHASVVTVGTCGSANAA